MKRIVTWAIGALIISILVSLLMAHYGVDTWRKAGMFLTILGMDLLVGLVVPLAVGVWAVRRGWLKPQLWSGQDNRAASVALVMSGIFVGFVVQGVLVPLIVQDQSVTGSVGEAFAIIFFLSIFGGGFYLLYRFAERAQSRGSIKNSSDRREKFLLVLKLIASGFLILVVTLSISKGDWTVLIQHTLTRTRLSYDRREGNPAIRIVWLHNKGLSHASYLRANALLTSTLSGLGAKVIVVPVPSSLVNTPETILLARELFGSGNVVAGVASGGAPNDNSLRELDPPLPDMDTFDWGVISGVELPGERTEIGRFYPLSYEQADKGNIVPDVAIAAVKRFRRESNPESPKIKDKFFSFSGFESRTRMDGSIPVREELYWTGSWRTAMVDALTDSVRYWTKRGGDGGSGGYAVRPDSTWDDVRGAIVVVDPGEHVTGLWNFGGGYRNIIHQILTRNNSWSYDDLNMWIVVGILILLPLFLLWLRPWLAALFIFAIAAGQVSFYVWLASRFGILLEIVPPFVATFLGLFVFSFVHVSHQRRQADRRDKQRILDELRTAHDMQMGLMPTSDPVVQGFDISGVCNPADEVGGDYFDYVWLDEKKTRMGVAIADVSGKAMKAAMTAVMTSGMVYRELGSNETPKTILRKINRPMYFKTDKRIFTAMSFAVIDTVTKSLAFSNAGQMQPLLKRSGKIESLKVEGARLPLGMTEDVEYQELTISLQSGDMMVFYTDGIPEAMNPKNEMFGFERLEAIVKVSAIDLSAKQVAARIVEKVAEFAGSAKQHDDMTVVVVRVF